MSHVINSGSSLSSLSLFLPLSFSLCIFIHPSLLKTACGAQPQATFVVAKKEKETVEQTTDSFQKKKPSSNQNQALQNSKSSDANKPQKKSKASDKPGLFSVDQDAAERALERSLVQVDALLLAPGKMEYGINFSLSSNDFTRTGLDSVVGQSFLLRQEFGSNAYSSDFSIRAGFPYGTQLEFSIPFIVVEESFSETASDINTLRVGSDSIKGWGDLRVSLTKALFKEKGLRPDLTATLTYDSKNADDDAQNTLGSGNQEYEIGFQATKRQDPMVFTADLNRRISDSINGVTPGDSTDVSFSVWLAASPYTSLRFTFAYQDTQNTLFNGGDIVGSGNSSGEFSVGLSSVIGRGILASVSLAMGLTDSASDYRFSFGLSKQANLPFF